jgi:hypothetical protein
MGTSGKGSMYRHHAGPGARARVLLACRAEPSRSLQLRSILYDSSLFVFASFADERVAPPPDRACI